MLKKCLNVFFILFVVNGLFAQQISVNGIVKDADGEPLPEINVQVKGTNNGTVTDFDGKYQIQATMGSTLQFSAISYESQEILVSQPIINVALNDVLNELDEVVVTAFGIKKSEKALGFATQKVKAKDLDLKGQTNALELLQGRVSGVQVQKTGGGAGAGVDILIRGITSVDPSRNNQPLIIVDGLALNNDVFTGDVLPSTGSSASGSSEQFSFSNRAGDINPDDIESYDVLKGAAATALYGIRASNGAIIITTKKGKIGKSKIVITSSVTMSKVDKTPKLQKKFREGHRTSTRPGAVYNPDEEDGYDDYGFAFYSWGVPFTDDSFTQSNGTEVDLSKDRFYSPYDLFETGLNTQFNVSLSGASEKIDYFLSVGKNNTNGILPNTSYDKTNFRLKGGYKFNEKFRIESSVAFTKSGGARGNGGDKSIFSSLSYWSSTYNINDYINADGAQRNYSQGIIDNPRYFAETSNLKDTVNRWIANMNASWNPTDWLNVNYSAQIDNYADLRNRFVPKDLDVGTQVGGFIVDETINFTGLESNLLATFTKDFSEDFHTSLLIGNQISDLKTNYSFIRGEGLNVPGINDLSNTTNIFGGSKVTQLRSTGVFGDLRFDYKKAIFVSITGRNDWLSVMPAKNRSFFYPSVSTSFLLNELFSVDKNIVSFAKIRASWAQVGKGPNFGQIGQFYYKPNDFPFNGVGGYGQGNFYGDKNLKPERNNNFEIGTDLRFINNRIRFDYSYYKSKVSDQIFSVSTANSSGISAYLRNAGDYETWGNEFLLGGDIVRKDNFRWSANIMWSQTKGKVTAIPEDLNEILFFDDRITAKAKVGDAIGTLYGWVFKTAPDGQRVVDSDGKWTVTGSENDGFFYQGENEMVKVGNAMPDYIASMTNDFTFKRLTFNFLIEYKKGGDLYDRGFRNALRNGNLLETEFRDEDRILEGVMDDGNGNFVPNTTPLAITANGYYRDFNNYNSASEVLLQDGSWLKLRNIGLTYNFDQLSRIGIDNLAVSASANNIILWTHFKGFDPESNQFSAGSNVYGYTGLTTPLSVGYSMGVKFEF